VIFGIGVGWFAEEFAAAGARFDDRALRTREYIELMKVLWTAEDPTYTGKTFSVKGVRFNPKPVQKPHPPIVVGGTSELAIKRAVRYGDGWYAVARSMEEATRLLAQLEAQCRAANRTRPVEVTLSLRPGHPLTLDEARELGNRGVARLLVGMPLRAYNDEELARFRDDVMGKL